MREIMLYGLTATHTRLFQGLDDLTEEEAARIPASGLSPIIWQAGHLALSDFNAARRVDANSAAKARPPASPVKAKARRQPHVATAAVR